MEQMSMDESDQLIESNSVHILISHVVQWEQGSEQVSMNESHC